MPSEAVSFDTPNGTTARGVAHTGPAMERAFLRFEMPDGTFAVEEVYRSVEPAQPAPAPEAAPAAAEPPADA